MTISTRYGSTQWSNVESLFSALTYVGSTMWSSQRATTTNWRIDVLPPIYQRNRPDWFAGAKCLGACGHSNDNLFYADHQHNGQVNEAKSVCLGTHPNLPGRCPVLDQCLDYALANGEKWGVWGGCSERERRAIKRERSREAALQAGNIIALDQATPGHRRKPTEPVANVEAGDAASWRHSKGLIVEWRRQRTQDRCAASLGDLSYGLVSEG